MVACCGSSGVQLRDTVITVMVALVVERSFQQVHSLLRGTENAERSAGGA